MTHLSSLLGGNVASTSRVLLRRNEAQIVHASNVALPEVLARATAQVVRHDVLLELSDEAAKCACQQGSAMGRSEATHSFHSAASSSSAAADLQARIASRALLYELEAMLVSMT